MKRKFILIGSYGRANMGDDIFLLQFLKLLQGHRVSFNCSGEDLLPPEIKQLLNDKHASIDTRFFKGSKKKIRILRECDAVIYGGGELWMRLGGIFKNISLYKMILVNVTARAAGKKVYYVSCGAENLTGWSRLLAITSSNLATYCYLRDKKSATILSLAPAKYSVIPDIATTLPISFHDKKNAAKPPVVGINVLYDIGSHPISFREYLNEIALFINEHDSKYKFIIIPFMTEKSYAYNDIWASKELNKLLKHEIKIEHYSSIEKTLRQIKSTDILISTRLHLSIIGLLSSVNVIGLNYKPKVRKFYTETLPQNQCVDLVKNFRMSISDCLENYTNSTSDLESLASSLQSRGVLSYEDVFAKVTGENTK